MYRIGQVCGEQELDALPVAKITDYPMEERDYRPFAQNIICVDKGGNLIIRMWAFEVSPSPTSELRAVLYIFADNPESALHVRAFIPANIDAKPEHEVFIANREGKKIKIITGYSCRDHSGEDLQGVYWGAEFTISKLSLQSVGETLLLNPGDNVPGNFYKTCLADKRIHSGSFFPCDWGAPYDIESMDAFTLVNY